MGARPPAEEPRKHVRGETMKSAIPTCGHLETALIFFVFSWKKKILIPLHTNVDWVTTLTVSMLMVPVVTASFAVNLQQYRDSTLRPKKWPLISPD